MGAGKNKRWILTEAQLLAFAKHKNILELPVSVEIPEEAEIYHLAKGSAEILSKGGLLHDGSILLGYISGMNFLLKILNLK